MGVIVVPVGARGAGVMTDAGARDPDCPNVASGTDAKAIRMNFFIKSLFSFMLKFRFPRAVGQPRETLNKGWARGPFLIINFAGAAIRLSTVQG